MRELTPEDKKNLEEIRKWLTWDESNHLALRADAPQEIRDLREKIAKKYFPFG